MSISRLGTRGIMFSTLCFMDTCPMLDICGSSGGLNMYLVHAILPAFQMLSPWVSTGTPTSTSTSCVLWNLCKSPGSLQFVFLCIQIMQHINEFGCEEISLSYSCNIIPKQIVLTLDWRLTGSKESLSCLCWIFNPRCPTCSQSHLSS